MTFKKILAASALVLFGAPASGLAAVVDTAPCANNSALTCATAITGLDVDGDIFNVTFSTGSYDAVYAGGDPYFFGDQAGSSAAASAIADALDGLVSGVLGAGDGQNYALVPFSADVNLFFAGVTGGNTTPWGSGGSLPFVNSDFDLTPLQAGGNHYNWTNFELVPVPAAVWLLGSALLGLAGFRRRLK